MREFLSNRRNVILAVIGVMVLCIIAGVGLSLIGQRANTAAQQSNLREAQVGRGDLREVVSATGPVEAKQRSDLSFVVAGKVQQIVVTEGQSVTRESDLMVLDTSQLQLDLATSQLAVDLQQIAFNQLVEGADTYDIQAARAAVSRSAAQLAQLTAPTTEETVRLAQQNYELAQNNLWRAQAGRDQVVLLEQFNIMSENQVFEANQDVASAELSVKIAEQQLINAQQGVASADIAAARASLAQSQASLNRLLEGPTPTNLRLAQVQIEQAMVSLERANLAIDNATLTAPFDGTITAINYGVGEQASPGQPAATILDESSFHVDIQVDEIDIAKTEEGQVAFVKLDAAPEATITGHVSRIAPDGVAVRGVVSYEVRIEIDSSDALLKDGMTATVDIVVSELTNVLLVPNWAIRVDRSTNEAFVNVKRDDRTIEEINIVLGQRGESFSEVQHGLEEGDTVVLSLERENPFAPGEAEGAP